MNTGMYIMRTSAVPATIAVVAATAWMVWFGWDTESRRYTPTGQMQRYGSWQFYGYALSLAALSSFYGCRGRAVAVTIVTPISTIAMLFLLELGRGTRIENLTTTGMIVFLLAATWVGVIAGICQIVTEMHGS